MTPGEELLFLALGGSGEIGMVMTERVNFSASLRRVRPNISQTRPISASGPVRIATHCAICGLVSGSVASARPADQAV